MPMLRKSHSPSNMLWTAFHTESQLTIPLDVREEMQEECGIIISQMEQSLRVSTLTHLEQQDRLASLAKSNQVKHLSQASHKLKHVLERARWHLQSRKDPS